ncbi:MAG: type II toxin-antitoxin system PemK/MazF family toxin [Alphaproteobacteria bacterium]|nr:type II toxin-antitoxin system PemK/MazF family toxin [Alphaproteobacteria bacterium]
MVLICDFNTGFIPPEMVKKRRVIVISPYQQNKRGICTVVPISTRVPEYIEDFHSRIPAAKYRFLSQQDDSWVKADMIYTVALKRLDRIRVGEAFLTPSISADDFNLVCQSVRAYLDFV